VISRSLFVAGFDRFFPGADGWHRNFNGVRGRWFEGDVWTGGYQDHMMMRAVTQGGQPALEVHIWHKSLDSKPSAWDHYVYRKIGNT
jgi:hypothetical protein